MSDTLSTKQARSKALGDYIAVESRESGARGRMLTETDVEGVKYFTVKYGREVVTYRWNESLDCWIFRVTELTRVRV